MRKSFKLAHLHRLTVNSYFDVETPFQLENIHHSVDFLHLIFYLIQLFFIEAIQCSFRFLIFIQIFKSFKLAFIQASYSAWRQPSLKHSNHSNLLLFEPAVQCGVSLSTNIQIFKSFKLYFIKDSIAA